MGTRLLLGQFYILIILMLGFLAQDLTLPSMGISESIHFIPALAIGVLAGIVFIYGTNWFIERIGMGDSLSDRSVAVIAQVIPRSKAQKVLAFVALSFLNPMTEEAFYRGVLVHHWHFVGQPIVLVAAIGALVNFGNHLYQGLPLQLFHLAFFCVAAMLLFSPVGLMGAIGFHIVGDVYPLIMAKSELERYRQRYSRVSTSKHV